MPELLQQILEICHPIVFDTALYDKIQSQLNRPAHQRRGFDSAVLRTLMQAAARPCKLEYRDTAPSFPEETDIPQKSQDDTFIVRLAVASGATLVTADEPLRSGLAACSIQTRYALNVLSPEDALAAV